MHNQHCFHIVDLYGLCLLYSPAFICGPITLLSLLLSWKPSTKLDCTYSWKISSSQIPQRWWV